MDLSLACQIKSVDLRVGGGDGWGRGEQWGEMERTILDQQFFKKLKNTLSSIS